MEHIGSVVTIKEIQTYFKHGGDAVVSDETWRTREWNDGSFTAESPTFEISFKPSGVVYNVEVEATDDPEDSNSAVTDDPIGFLGEFLETGTDIDHIIKQSSFKNIEKFVQSIRKVSSAFSHNVIDASTVGRTMRRIIAKVKRMAGEFDESRSIIEDKELSKIKKSLSDAGWKVKEDKAKNGLSSLKIQFGDEFQGEITVDSILWDYSIKLNGIDESKRTGVAEDPIETFRDFLKDPEIRELHESSVQNKKNRSYDDATVAPPRRESALRKFELNVIKCSMNIQRDQFFLEIDEKTGLVVLMIKPHHVPSDLIDSFGFVIKKAMNRDDFETVNIVSELILQIKRKNQCILTKHILVKLNEYCGILSPSKMSWIWELIRMDLPEYDHKKTCPGCNWICMDVSNLLWKISIQHLRKFRLK